MKQNEKGAQELLEMCRSVKEWVGQCQEAPPIIAGALDELRVVASFFTVVSPPIEDQLSEGMEVVSTLRTAAHSALHLIKTALRQCQYWANLEVRFGNLDHCAP